MTSPEQLHGTWELQRWYCTLDGQFHNYPFGHDARGRITYSPNGTMSAILMDPDRQPFAIASLAKGTGAELQSAIQGYVSYAGRFEIIGEDVHHQVEYSLLPNWIGTTLIRTMSWQDDHLVLATKPEKTQTGRIVINHLHWHKIS